MKAWKGRPKKGMLKWMLKGIAIKNGMERVNEDEISDEFNEWVGEVNIYKDEMKRLRKVSMKRKRWHCEWLKSDNQPRKNNGESIYKI